MRVVFMGSPAFALPTLRRLIESEHDVVGVVTQPDRPAGRNRRVQPPPAKELALSHDLAVLQPARVNAEESLDALRALAPDAIVIAAYGQILKQPLLDIPALGLLNVHASLLPAYRGASPLAAALLAGERETGVTIQEVVLALDAGPIVGRRSLAIEDSDTTGTLTEKLANLGADLLLDVFLAWGRGEIAPEPQDDAQATYAPTLRREDGVVDWQLPAVDIWRRVRAYNPWPVATTTVSGDSLRILEAWPLARDADVLPGQVVELPTQAEAPAGAGFAVCCGDGLLAVVRAQRAGKRAVSGDELLRGYRGLVGKRLGS